MGQPRLHGLHGPQAALAQDALYPGNETEPCHLACLERWPRSGTRAKARRSTVVFSSLPSIQIGKRRQRGTLKKARHRAGVRWRSPPLLLRDWGVAQIE